MLSTTNRRAYLWLLPLAGCGLLLLLVSRSSTQPPDAEKGKPGGERGQTSYDQISKALLGEESFQAMKSKDIADKPAVMARQKKLLDERYNLRHGPIASSR